MKVFIKFRSVLLFSVLIVFTANARSQTSMPDELTKSPLKDQINYIEEHTKIYENFRAIREDMFQKIKKNILDSLSTTSSRVAALNSRNSGSNRTIDSLQSSLDSTKTSLTEITRSKNSVKFLGMEVEKGTYNTIMWSIVIGLLLITLVVFLIYKRNQSVIDNRNKDLQDLRTEFEVYRKTSREAREKMAQQHFNELKRLRGE